jgi:uncharacterized membrane protein YbaN (DUF454 family)
MPPVIGNILVLTLISVGLLLLSVLAIGIVVVHLPEKYFVLPRRPWWRHREQWTGLEIAKTAAKNLAGALLVIVGILLCAVPGVPGQSLLTVFMGLFLVDFPGKYRLQCWILRRRGVSRTVNRLRILFGRVPLAAPES